MGDAKVNFDISRLKNVSDLSNEDVEFIKGIGSRVIDSEDYEEYKKYLSEIYQLTVLEIEEIVKVYLDNYALEDEKEEYLKKIKEINSLKRKEGFIDISAMISVTIFICTVGITLAVILYNLL